MNEGYYCNALLPHHYCITLFICIKLLCGTDNIIRNIPRIQFECEEYFAECYVAPTNR